MNGGIEARVSPAWSDARELEVLRAKARICEQVRDDLASQLRAAITQIERLKYALRNYHDCQSTSYHLKTDAQVGLEGMLKKFIQEYADAKKRSSDE